jgi:hypothetical protein
LKEKCLALESHSYQDREPTGMEVAPAKRKLSLTMGLSAPGMVLLLVAAKLPNKPDYKVLGNFFKSNIHQSDFYLVILLHFTIGKSSELLMLDRPALFYP